MSSPVRLEYDGRWLIRNLLIFCVSVELLFFVLDFQINYARATEVGALRRLFNTAREDSLPSWFGIMQTAMVALTIWAIYLLVKGRVRRWRRAGWMALALFFTYLAFDDGAHIHERLGTAYDETAATASSLGAWSLAVFPSYRWQIVFMPIFTAMGAFMLVFLLREMRGGRKLLVLAALACLSLAVGLDFFEGLAEDHPWNPYSAVAARSHLEYWTWTTFERSPYDTLLHFSKSFEECIEMLGMTLFWAAFLGHLTELANGVGVRFVDGAGGRARVEKRHRSGATPELAGRGTPATTTTG